MKRTDYWKGWYYIHNSRDWDEATPRRGGGFCSKTNDGFPAVVCDRSRRKEEKNEGGTEKHTYTQVAAGILQAKMS